MFNTNELYAVCICMWWQVLRDIAQLGPEVLFNISELYEVCICMWQVLCDIAQLGPEVLFNISEWYTMCVDSELIPVSQLHTLVWLNFLLCCVCDVTLL